MLENDGKGTEACTKNGIAFSNCLQRYNSGLEKTGSDCFFLFQYFNLNTSGIKFDRSSGAQSFFLIFVVLFFDQV